MTREGKFCPPVAHPDTLGFAPDRLNRMTSAFQSYVDGNEIPGAVVLIARNDKVACFKAIGFAPVRKRCR
jgi:hypothetical protein